MRITLSMLVRNEENRYLGRVLDAARGYIDDAVILDDASEDGTVSLCRERLEGIPLNLVESDRSRFHNEWEARKRQWEETVSTMPDWILFLDADEIFEEAFSEGVKVLAADNDCDGWLFRLYDMWDEEHYRDDDLWCAHNTFRPFMIRYKPGYDYHFFQTSQHCGRMPYNISGNLKLSTLRLKHYGWAKPEDRMNKYNRYMQLDPGGVYGSLAQYESILDENVQLKRWLEHE